MPNNLNKWQTLDFIRGNSPVPILKTDHLGNQILLEYV